MKLLKKIFNRKLSWEPHNFTDNVTSGEKIVIFCPEDSYKTFLILSRVLGWKNHFQQIIMILPNYEFAFFNKIYQNKIVKYYNVDDEIKSFNNSVIFNFSLLKKNRKILDHCKNSSILNITNPANLQFIPIPKDSLSLLKKFADFFGFPWESYQFNIEFSKSELLGMEDLFIKNRFKNFILDFSSQFSSKKIGKIVQTIKNEFSANIYFIGKKIHDKDFINIEEIEVANLLELHNLAKVSDLFITDKPEIAGLFAYLDIDQIFLGSNFDCGSLKCVEQKNIFEMKNVIEDILKK